MRQEQREKNAHERLQKRGVLLLERYAGDCVTGSLRSGFERWRNTVQRMVLKEHNHAARKIQAQYRTYRARLLLRRLRELSRDTKQHRRFQQRRVRRSRWSRREFFHLVLVFGILRSSLDESLVDYQMYD